MSWVTSTGSLQSPKASVIFVFSCAMSSKRISSTMVLRGRVSRPAGRGRPPLPRPARPTEGVALAAVNRLRYRDGNGDERCVHSPRPGAGLRPPPPELRPPLLAALPRPAGVDLAEGDAGRRARVRHLPVRPDPGHDRGNR